MAERYSPDELAVIWKVSSRTVRRRCESGDLRAFRVGDLWRIPASAVAEYEARHSNASAEPAPVPQPVAPARGADVSGREYSPVVKGVVPWRTEVIS